MAGSFNKLRDEMSPDARDRVSSRVRDTLLEMTLQELRQNAPDKTQVELVARFPDADVRITQFEPEDDGKAAAGA